MSKKNLRRVNWLVSAQTLWNVNKLAQIEGTTPGEWIGPDVLDARLVRISSKNLTWCSSTSQSDTGLSTLYLGRAMSTADSLWRSEKR